MTGKHNIIFENINTKLTCNKEDTISNKNIDKNNENLDIKSQENNDLKCSQCNKEFSKKWILKRHSDTCKGIYNPFECKNCHKELSSYSALSRHRKTCASTQLILHSGNDDAQVSVQNIDTQNNTNIETQNNTNIQTQVNNNVTINVLKFPEYGEDYDFMTDHITREMYKNIWDQNKPEIGFRKFVDAVLNRPENRVVKKNNPNINYSMIHQGDDKWELAHDKDVFPILTHQMSCAALQCTHDYKKKMYFMRTDIQRILGYLDDVNTENDDDETHFKDAVQRIRLMVVNVTKRWEEELAALETESQAVI
jgi:hypothetical protein